MVANPARRSDGGNFRTADRRGTLPAAFASGTRSPESLTGGAAFRRSLTLAGILARVSSGVKRPCKRTARRDGREPVRHGRTQRRAVAARFRRNWAGETRTVAAIASRTANGCAHGGKNPATLAGIRRRGVPMFAGIRRHTSGTVERSPDRLTGGARSNGGAAFRRRVRWWRRSLPAFDGGGRLAAFELKPDGLRLARDASGTVERLPESGGAACRCFPRSNR